MGCSGNEDDLSLCPHRGWGVHNCDHDDDAGVCCDPGMYIQLINTVYLRSHVILITKPLSVSLLVYIFVCWCVCLFVCFFF